MARALDAEPVAHSFDDAILAHRSEKIVPGLLKPRSIDANLCGLRQLSAAFGDLDLESTDWRRVGAELYAAEGHSAWRRLQLLRSVLISARKRGWLSRPHGLNEIIRKAEYLPREAVYTEAQISEFLAACERLDRQETTFWTLRGRAREVLRVLALTGCRLREVCTLRFDDVKAGALKLRDSKTGPRIVPICNEAQLVLGRQRVCSGWVFVGRFMTSPISPRTVQSEFVVVRKEAGLREGVTHTLRHSFATIAIRNGVPIQALQRILGHASASWVTARYVHLARRDTQLACAVVANAIANAGGGK